VLEETQEARRSINQRINPDWLDKDIPYSQWVRVVDAKKTDERFGYSASCVPSGALRRLPQQVLSEIEADMKSLEDSRFNPREREVREQRAAASLRSHPTPRNEDIILAKVRKAMIESAVYSGKQQNRPKADQVDVVNQFFKDSQSILRTKYGLGLRTRSMVMDGNALIDIFVEHSREVAAARVGRGEVERSRVRIVASSSNELRKILADQQNCDLVAHSRIINDEVQIYGRSPPKDEDRRQFIMKHIT
jgi:hypothetical protein